MIKRVRSDEEKKVVASGLQSLGFTQQNMVRGCAGFPVILYSFFQFILNSTRSRTAFQGHLSAVILIFTDFTSFVFLLRRERHRVTPDSLCSMW